MMCHLLCVENTVQYKILCVKCFVCKCKSVFNFMSTLLSYSFIDITKKRRIIRNRYSAVPQY